MPGLLQRLGQLRQVRGNLAGHVGGLPRGVQRRRVSPDQPQALADLFVGQVFEPDAKGAGIGKRQVGFARLGEVGKYLEAVPDIHHQQERRIGLARRQRADIALGLAAGFHHRVIPGAGAAHGLGGLLLLDDAGFLRGQFKLRGRRLGRLELLGLQDEAGAFIEIDAALGGGTVRMVLGYVEFERVARIPRRLGSGHAQHVTKLAEERLAVGPFGSAGGGPPGDERVGTRRRHGPQDNGRGLPAASLTRMHPRGGRKTECRVTKNLKSALKEAVEFNRAEARAAAQSDYEEALILA